MNKTITIFALLLTLFACSDDTGSKYNAQDEKSTANNTPKQSIKQSKLVGLIGKDNSCEQILSVQKLEKLFSIKTEIRIAGSEYNGSAYCDFSWNRADKAEREGKYLYYLTDRMNGKVKETPKRLRTFTSSFRIVVSKTTVQPGRYVPPQKSEEAIQQLVDRAIKSASDALSDEQKALAGDSANDMIESLIRKSNQITEIKKLGDAAYWSNLMDGMLYILDGNADIQLSIIEIGNTIEEDMANAQKIAKAILH